MSKSLNNAIGIHEPPFEMYGKLMSISDDLMWKYWTLLTDLRQSEIAQMQADVASGALHPMQAKKNLAHSITTDFHSKAEADSAADNWSLQFQRGGVSHDLEEVQISLESLGARWEYPLNDRPHALVKLSKLLVAAGLAESNSDGERKIKAGAAKPDESVQIQSSDRGVTEIVLIGGDEFSLRVGKRAKKVKIC